MKNGDRKWDNRVVPRKSPNKGGQSAAPPAEEGEERGLAEGNAREQPRPRAQDGMACNKRCSRYEKQRFEIRG